MCLFAHFFAKRSLRAIRSFWPVIVTVNTGIFVTVYVYQFQDLANAIQKHWPVSNSTHQVWLQWHTVLVVADIQWFGHLVATFSPADLGLVLYTHNLEWALLGNAFCFVLSIMQGWSFVAVYSVRRRSHSTNWLPE